MKVRKLPVLLVALLVLIVFQSGSVEAQTTKSPRARFELYNAYRPMGLKVWAIRGAVPAWDAPETNQWLGDRRRFNDRFRIAAESRLRAARLYADLSDDAKTNANVSVYRRQGRRAGNVFASGICQAPERPAQR